MFFLEATAPTMFYTFPYTTLFRSLPAGGCAKRHADRGRDDQERKHERSEEHTSELQSRQYLVCRLLLEKKNDNSKKKHHKPSRCAVEPKKTDRGPHRDKH